MKAMIRKASDWNYKVIKEVDDLTDLQKIYSNLVVDFNPIDKDVEVDIWIYDDYME